jgi:hypothetical protein
MSAGRIRIKPMTPIRPIAAESLLPSEDDHPRKRPQPRERTPFRAYLAAIETPHVAPHQAVLSASTGAAIAILNRALSVGAE